MNHVRLFAPLCVRTRAAVAQRSRLRSCAAAAGADVLSQANDDASVLYEASASGDPALLGLLLDYGADANVARNTGHMPIHRVAHRGHLE